MKRIGLTGGIGSGKTTVAKLLSVLGFPVYNSDERAKIITNTNPNILLRVRELFGDRVFNSNGELNRIELGQIVFSDANKLQILNNIIHPEVAIDFENWIKHQHTKVVFKEAAIIFELGLEEHLDQVWAVSAPDDIRINRVVSRSDISEEEVKERMKRQLPQSDIIEKASFVIINDNKHLIIPQVLQAINEIS
jgi:dephospho-CoA kinase